MEITILPEGGSPTGIDVWVPAIPSICWFVLVVFFLLFNRRLISEVLHSFAERIKKGASVSTPFFTLGEEVRPGGIDQTPVDESNRLTIVQSQSKEGLSNSEMVIRKIQEKYGVLITSAANVDGYEFDGLFRYKNCLVGLRFIYIDDYERGVEQVPQLKGDFNSFAAKAPKELKALYAVVFRKEFEQYQSVAADIGFAVRNCRGRILTSFFMLPDLKKEFELRRRSSF